MTLDVDAQLIETSKANAKYCYDGRKAFQAVQVPWAETLLVLADELRDGNVPAGKDMIRVVDDAFAMLPPGPWQVRVRSDSAAYDQHVLDHWAGRGWEFAVSADMTPQLRQEIERLPVDSWHMWKIEHGNPAKGPVVREWAEVPYVPTRQYEKKDSRPYRYLAVRVRRQQGELFEDGVAARHFAVVTNRWDMEGQKLLEWHRGLILLNCRSQSSIKNWITALIDFLRQSDTSSLTCPKSCTNNVSVASILALGVPEACTFGPVRSDLIVFLPPYHNQHTPPYPHFP